MNLSGVKVLVTGGTSGIGLALVEQLKHAGARIIVVSRSLEKLQALQATHGLEAVYACNLADVEATLQTFAQIKVDHPDLQVLINNAGIQQNEWFADDSVTFASIQEEIAINFTTPILITKQVLPVLQTQPQSAIVNLTSGLALVPKLTASVYCGTKGGLHLFSQGLRNQLAGSNVRVIEVLPPVVDTPMTHDRAGEKLSPETVATTILDALRSGPDEVLVGKTKLLALINRLAPSLARKIMNK
jgi:short-subunit dehydrogenase involved in D-alanine esterification of teichoic acids